MILSSDTNKFEEVQLVVISNKKKKSFNNSLTPTSCHHTSREDVSPDLAERAVSSLLLHQEGGVSRCSGRSAESRRDGGAGRVPRAGRPGAGGARGAGTVCVQVVLAQTLPPGE